VAGHGLDRTIERERIDDRQMTLPYDEDSLVTAVQGVLTAIAIAASKRWRSRARRQPGTFTFSGGQLRATSGDMRCSGVRDCKPCFVLLALARTFTRSCER
jgi:hypothetical protein